MNAPVPGVVVSQKVGVLGAGAWGTALAQCMALAGHDVMVWDRDDIVVGDITKRHENRRRYPDIPLVDSLRATSDLDALLAHSEVVLAALPSDVHTTMAAQLSDRLQPGQVLVMAGKGFRESDGALLVDVWREACPQLTQVCVLGGPTFAREMMERKITACVVASTDEWVRSRVAELFAVPFIRVYENDDMVGVQVGGAIKNVLAIAAGILDGLDMGNNARAAMLTRGLIEMGRYSVVMGGQDRTIWGMAGMGDLLLTATSTLSRNYRFGHLVGKGVAVPEAKLRVGTVEGMLAARIVTVQAQAHGLDLAIVSAVDDILHGDVTPLKALDYLMQRPRVQEFER